MPATHSILLCHLLFSCHLPATQEPHSWREEDCNLVGQYALYLYTDWVGQLLYGVSAGVVAPFVCAGYNEQ